MALSLLDCVMTTLSMQDLQNPRNNFIKFHFFSPALCWHIRFFSRKRLTIWPHANRVIYAIAKVKLENEKRCDSRESRRCEIAYFCRSDRWQRIWSTIPPPLTWIWSPAKAWRWTQCENWLHPRDLCESHTGNWFHRNKPPYWSSALM